MTDFKRFCRAWAWKREHRPDKERFDRPYRHTIQVPASEGAEAQQQPGAQQHPRAQQRQAAEQQLQQSSVGGAGERLEQGAEQQQQHTETCTLVIKQRKFGPEGFAST
mgnify:CR=1 FL=1